MRPLNSLKNALFNSLYRSSIISTAFATIIVCILVFLSIEKDLREEGKYLGQLVFKELRQAMNRGASYDEVNQLIDDLNRSAPDVSYSMYRGEGVQSQFGLGRNLTEEISQHLNGQNDATHIESLDKIHYFRAIQFKQECLQCHTGVSTGDIAGVLDVSFPASRVRIPITEVLMGLFLVFSVTIISSYLALSTDLLSHMITPLQRLERKLKETEGHHDLDEKLELGSNLKEILSIEHSFNAQQELLHQAFQKVEEVSIYDKLTSTYNRHQLDHLFTEETVRAMRQQKPMTIAMIDLNGFKQINDTHGHQAGDEILIHFCSVLTKNLRITDKVIRYGGDEFIVLLPDCKRDEAEQLFQRIERITTAEPYHYKGQVLFTQFSTGIAEFPHEADSENGFDLIQTADERMYKEKQRKKTRNVK
ncbi:GGDEF domain-containing protein [uncultured Neptuniibacter sp.]|uniref:GGDEF domain-containing protein n=1 Tax=uncultured Neptuniibacter sp. TaxID=502143 RepID=UPI0026153FD4|nr:GGDEF domain-containing protein [uncultured Neptuniibacter sp.]